LFLFGKAALWKSFKQMLFHKARRIHGKSIPDALKFFAGACHEIHEYCANLIKVKFFNLKNIYA